LPAVCPVRPRPASSPPFPYTTLFRSFHAEAHRVWMLPSATVLSGNEAWVTVDGAVSTDLFYFEHVPLRLDGLAISAPDGSAVEAARKSTRLNSSHVKLSYAVLCLQKN